MALGKALHLSAEEVNQLLAATRNPSFAELKDLACYEYELELLEEFSRLEAAPGGMPRPQSPFYIERHADNQLQQQLTGTGTTTTIQAGRQTGKTSLLTHAINTFQGRIIYLDFHLVDEASKVNLAGLLRFLSEAIVEQLDLEWDAADGYWQAAATPQRPSTGSCKRKCSSVWTSLFCLPKMPSDVIRQVTYTIW